ncbi:MAG: PAS domain S-box protein [Deltaproteobacteria bacterium]|nr:PAS domain S-box protein [Deltaproteobacteria bacterium]
MGSSAQSGPVMRLLRGHAAARYGLAVATVAAAFGLRIVFEPITGTGAPYVLFFGALLAVSILAGSGPGILATALSMVLGAIWFVTRAGYSPSNAAWQAALFSIDGVVAVYLAHVMRRSRQTAEEARDRLDRSERNLRELIELAPDAFFLADLDARFIDVNQAACEMLGYTRQELIGKTILDIIPAEDVARLMETRSKLLAPGKVERGEWRHKRKDGSYLPVDVSANILPDGRWQAFVRDITQRKRLDEERQIFQALLENSPDFIGIADPSGKPIWGNPAALRMVGLPPDFDVRQTQIRDYYPPDVRGFVDDVIVKEMMEKGRWAGETYFRNWQTGESIPVSDVHFNIRDAKTGKILGAGTITRDITEQRQRARELEELLERERATNHQLRESEERFRLTIDEAPIGMCLVDLDGRFFRVNQALCEITGYSPEELAKLRFQDITHPEDLDTDLALVGKLTRGEIPKYQLEKRYIRKDKSVVWIMLSGSILRGPDGKPIYYIAQIEDISERKKAEEALKASQARFAGIISLSPEAIISIDESQRITLFNEGAEKIFGYSKQEALGAPLDILIPKRDQGRHRKDVDAFGRGEVSSRTMAERHSQILGRRKSGEEFSAEASISKLSLAGGNISTVVLRDVTERRRQEWRQRFMTEVSALLGSSLDYSRTLEDVASLVVRDFADWCIVKLGTPGTSDLQWKVACGTPAMAAIGMELEKVPIRRQWPAFVRMVGNDPHPVLIERVEDSDLEAIAQNSEHLRLLQSLDAASLMDVPLLVRGQLLGALVFISSDPSHAFHQADLELAQALAERATLAIENGRLYETAVQASQLRDQVLAVVAHDLRNPLSVILSQVGALSLKEEPERRRSRSTALIQRSATRMNRLIQDLLDVAVIEAGQLSIERTRVSPNDLLEESMESQRPLAEASSLTVQLELSPGLPDVWGDPYRLLQVVENLVGNAIKFSTPGGHIRIGAALREGTVLFWVADTGRGIAPEALPRVFDRFWQAKKGARQGAGLGLPISRGIVEAHGGKMWVESTLGSGSTFFFTVPSTDSTSRAVAEPSNEVSDDQSDAPRH